MNQQRGVALRVGVLLLLTPIAVRVGAQSPVPEPPTAPAAESADESDYILYQVRPGEDPSKVARMFNLTVEELLARNRISDPRRLTAGATLKIPDPRALRLARLRSEKDALEQQLSAAQASRGELEQSIHALEGQVAELRTANQLLEQRQMLYPVWRAAVFIAAAAAACAGFGLLVVLAKARDEARRRQLAVKETELLRVAMEKHRQLGAQFELKYQNLFHQWGGGPVAQERAHSLLQAYEEDRARLDAIVEEAERALKGSTTTQPPEAATRRSGNPVVRLSTARKSG